ncbi:MAG: acryloyl-CoA reductase [Planctomycetales bacterium]|nr:acryloyl-CoA reductase [Planctomycetales bacterium]
MFSAIVVREKDDNHTTYGVEQLRLDELPQGEVLFEVEYSSLNYKDALACRGHRGVVSRLPHVPGIDCAGEVRESTSPDYPIGQKVLVTGYDLGSGAWGGFSRFVRVPATWVVALPRGLTTRSAMTYGTAGFTAAQCVDALRRHGVLADSGPVVVTGATGGVGCLAVAILAKLGYEVTAVSGKPDWHGPLRELGAKRVAGRELVAADERPMLKSQWAGAVDTVGNGTLATLVKSLSYRGCVAACGLVAGDQLPLSVYPFLLRGVTLAGIDSAKCPREPRMQMWQNLSGDWKVELPDEWITEVTLEQTPGRVERMLAGETAGRTLVRLRE